MQINLLRVKIFRAILQAGTSKKNYGFNLQKDYELLNYLFDGAKKSKHRSEAKKSSTILELQPAAAASVQSNEDVKLRGGWPHTPPFGYTKLPNGLLVPNEGAHAVKVAFDLILKHRKQVTVRKELHLKGIDIRRGHLYKMMRNKLYVGIVKTLPSGAVVYGPHEPLISHEVFSAVGRLLDSQTHRYKQRYTNDKHPLQGFVRDVAEGKHYCCRKGGYGLLNNADWRDGRDFHAQFATFLTKFLTRSKQKYLETISLSAFRRFQYTIQVKNRVLAKQLNDGDVGLTTEAVEMLLGWKFFENEYQFQNFSIHAFQEISTKWLNCSYPLQREFQFLLFPKGVFFDYKKNLFSTKYYVGQTLKQ